MSERKTEGAPRGTLAPGQNGAGMVRERGRFSAQRKMEAVLRVLHGEPLDVVSRELGRQGGCRRRADRSVVSGSTTQREC